MTFHDLPDHARLWVHTADRDLTAGEQEAVLQALAGFLDGWAAHGAALTAAGAVLYNRVLVVGLALSVAFMGLAATFIAKLLQRHSWIAYVGLLIILYVAIAMIWEGSVELLEAASTVTP